MSAQEFDLIIIGAGMAGLALANSVRQSTLRVAIIEANPLPTKESDLAPAVDNFDPRVSALTPATIKFFDGMGLWTPIAQERHCLFHRMEVWDAKGTGAIQFAADEFDADHLGCIVENAVTLRVLANGISGAGNITLFNPARLAALRNSPEPGALQCIELEDGRQLTASLIVAADGGNSQLRQLADFESRAWSYEQSAIVATVQTAKPHQNTAWQRFMPEGPLAFLPLAGAEHNLCSIVWSLDHDCVEGKLQLSEDAFCQQLASAFEGRLGDVVACSKRYSFPLRQQHATDYVKAGIALIGDAAHVIHPLAGQGVNLGFADVAVLSEELLRAFNRGEILSSGLFLQRYQRRRKADNLTMMAAVEGFKRLFGRRELPWVWLRNAGMRQVNQIAPLKRQIARQAMGL